MASGRGRLNSKETRATVIQLITQAVKDGARQIEACKIIGLNPKTYQRWTKGAKLSDARQARDFTPPNKLTECEREQIISIVNENKYSDLPVCKIVPALADQGVYIASESTFYRVLKQEKLLAHRNKTKPKRKVTPPRELKATQPNQVYSWDITYLKTTIKGVFYYLYMVMDVFSRKIVGWQVYENESMNLAADLMTDICNRENIKQTQLTLHSDNGSPMKGATMLATLEKLGVSYSFSRPSVSNDNPYSESLFKTLKYGSSFPDKPFDQLKEARNWVEKFKNWYNNEHLHSGIKFVTPNQRHEMLDEEILAKRVVVYQRARAKTPSRWSKNIRDWSYIGQEILNPLKIKVT